MKNKVTFAVLLLIAFGVYTAYSRHHSIINCDLALGAQLRDMPDHGARLVLFPSLHLASAQRLSPRIGWIVSYSSPHGFSSQGFFVSMSGTILETGAPLDVASVAERHKKMTDFVAYVSRVDTLLKPGTTLRDAIATLGPPLSSETNGLQVAATYCFGVPPMMVGMLTNGFNLAFSNGVLVAKHPMFEGSH